MDWRRGTRCPLKNRVITPVSRVIIPPLTHLFLAIYRGPIANTIFNNDRLGPIWKVSKSRLAGCTIPEATKGEQLWDLAVQADLTMGEWIEGWKDNKEGQAESRALLV